MIATIIGGGSHIQKLGFDIDRSDGKYIRNRFKLAGKGGAQWLYITSWNEWFEAMQIEPSREYKLEGINAVRLISAAFKSQSPRPLDGAKLSIAVRRLSDEELAIDVRNAGTVNLYCVTLNAGETEARLVRYVLPPEEIQSVSVRHSRVPVRVQANGFLPNNRIVESTVTIP